MRAYARQGILAVTAMNSGALLAALTQFRDLVELAPAAAHTAFRYWTYGLAISVLLWLFAYMAAAGYAHQRSGSEGFWTIVGLFLFVASVGLFGAGASELGTVFLRY